MYRCIRSLLLFLSFSAFAEVTRSLKDFLQAANSAGYNILFSSALVRPYYQITFDKQSPITLEQIQTALTAYDLELKAAPNDSFLVVSTLLPEIVSPPESTLDNDSTIEEVVVNASAHQFQMMYINSSLSIDRAGK